MSDQEFREYCERLVAAAPGVFFFRNSEECIARYGRSAADETTWVVTKKLNEDDTDPWLSVLGSGFSPSLRFGAFANIWFNLPFWPYPTGPQISGFEDLVRKTVEWFETNSKVLYI